MGRIYIILQEKKRGHWGPRGAQHAKKSILASIPARLSPAAPSNPSEPILYHLLYRADQVTSILSYANIIVWLRCAMAWAVRECGPTTCLTPVHDERIVGHSTQVMGKHMIPDIIVLILFNVLIITYIIWR